MVSESFRAHRVLAISAALATALVVIWQLWHRPVEDDHVLWSAMVWKPFEVDGRSFPHAALMVHAQLQGSKVPALMQLDLGNDPTVLYRYSNLAFGIKANTLHLITGTIANRRFQNESIRFLETGGQPTPTAGPILLGSLGGSFFKDRILLLDFVKQRVAILGKGAQLPRALKQEFDFLPVTRNRFGNLLITATINGRAEHDVVFDTGSSMLALATGRRNWTKWTNRREDDSRNSIIRANSWSRTAILIGAPLTGTLCAGRACIDHPLIFFESSGLQNLSFEGASAMGTALIGNVLFDGQFTVIVDLARTRLGLFRGSVEAYGN